MDKRMGRVALPAGAVGADPGDCPRPGRVSIRAAAAATGASRNTVKDHVQALTRTGRLTRRGAGRGAWYALS